MANMLKKITLLLLLISFTTLAKAECSDFESIEATTDAALTLLGDGEVFQQGKVLKKHLPSRRKETAVYLKSGALYYTFFGLVSTNCQAAIMKRTHGKY